MSRCDSMTSRAPLASRGESPHLPDQEADGSGKFALQARGGSSSGSAAAEQRLQRGCYRLRDRCELAVNGSLDKFLMTREQRCNLSPKPHREERFVSADDAHGMHGQVHAEFVVKLSADVRDHSLTVGDR